MNRYLTIYIPKTAVPAPVSRFLRTQAGLTKKQISQAKFRPGGIRKNGQQCRVTETAYPGDQIIVCLEADDVDSAQLESSSFTVYSSNHNFQFSADAISYSDSAASEFAGSDVNSHIYHSLAATSQILPELAIIYEDQDILAINKPAGIVTHPSGSHYSDSLANQVASYFRSKGEPTKVRSIGRLDKETSGILLFARNQTAAARLQNQREEGISEKTYLAAVSGFMPVDEDGAFHRISVPLAPDPDNCLKMVVSTDGTLPGSKHAETLYSVLKSNGPDAAAPASLVMLRLKTAVPIRSVYTWHLSGILFWVILCTVYRTYRIRFPGLHSTHGSLNFNFHFQLMNLLPTPGLPCIMIKMPKKKSPWKHPSRKISKNSMKRYSEAIRLFLQG